MDPAETLRAFLERPTVGVGDPQLAVEPLATRLELERAAFMSSAQVLSRDVEIGRLRVESATADVARADVAGLIVLVARHAVFGERQLVAQVNGPVELRRNDDGWKVATLRVGGVDAASGHFEPWPAVGRLDSGIVRCWAWLNRDGSYVVLEVENQGDDPLRLSGARIGVRMWHFLTDAASRPVQAVVGPGSTFTHGMGVSRLRLPREFHVTVVTDRGDVELVVRSPRKTPLGLQLRHLLNRRVQAQLIAVVGLALWALGLSPAVAGVALLVPGLTLLGTEVAGALMRVYSSAQVVYLVTGAIETAAGIVLVSQVGAFVALVALLSLVPLTAGRPLVAAWRYRRADVRP